MEKQIWPYRIEIWNDDHPSNPFEDWDGCPTIVHWHTRYNFGDAYPSDFPHPHEDREAALSALRDKYGCTVILPLYLYDHSGITVSTSPFSCPWDSGQVGFIFMDAKAIEDGWGSHPHPTDDQLPEIINSSLESFDRYLTGEVYGFTVEGPDGMSESVGGFYCDEEEVLKEAMAYVDDDVVAEFERIEKLKVDFPEVLNITIC